MTIEEEFFKTFGIKPIENPSFGDIECDECSYEDCDNCGWAIYPEITDKILLELICLHSMWCELGLRATNIDTIKRQVLRDLILENSHCFNFQREKLKKKIHSLFEVEE